MSVFPLFTIIFVDVFVNMAISTWQPPSPSACGESHIGLRLPTILSELTEMKINHTMFEEIRKENPSKVTELFKNKKASDKVE